MRVSGEQDQGLRRYRRCGTTASGAGAFGAFSKGGGAGRDESSALLRGRTTFVSGVEVVCALLAKWPSPPAAREVGAREERRRSS